MDCTIDTANDGQQFLDLMANPSTRSYDLICLDNYMPIKTGEQAVREFRALGRTELVIGILLHKFHWYSFTYLFKQDALAMREYYAYYECSMLMHCTRLTEDQNSYLEAGADRVLTKPIMKMYVLLTWYQHFFKCLC